MSWAKGIASALALGITIYSGAASADFISVNPTDDRTIGEGGGLAPQNHPYLHVGLSSAAWRAALEFSLAGIPGNAVINYASLFLMDPGGSTSGTLNFWGYEGDGVITAADVDNTLNLVLAMPFPGSVGIQNLNLTMTSFIKDIFEGGATWAGFLIGAATPNGLSGASSHFCSTDGAPYGCRIPVLYINYSVPPPSTEVPEPTSALVLLGALAGLAVARRRITGGR